jgi:hypothetical protein
VAESLAESALALAPTPAPGPVPTGLDVHAVIGALPVRDQVCDDATVSCMMETDEAPSRGPPPRLGLEPEAASFEPNAAEVASHAPPGTEGDGVLPEPAAEAEHATAIELSFGEEADSAKRHTVPEVARGLSLPTHVREALGYWRSRAEVADDEGDRAAMARAVAAARAAKSRAGALVRCSDRYSSVDGAPVESDAARVACLKAISAVVQTKGDGLPKETRGQVEECRAYAVAVARTAADDA